MYWNVLDQKIQKKCLYWTNWIKKSRKMHWKWENLFLFLSEIVQIVQRPENATSKLGMCPPYFALPHEGCTIECHTDAQCATDLKCCFAGCGYTCVAPIPIATAKPGQCPRLEETVPTASDKQCEQSCVDDTECGGTAKCCNRGKCDLVCVEPVGMKILTHSSLRSSPFQINWTTFNTLFTDFQSNVLKNELFSLKVSIHFSVPVLKNFQFVIFLRIFLAFFNDAF